MTAKQKPMKAKRKERMTPVSRLLPHEVKTAFRKYGFAQTEVVTRWREVVGDELAAHCQPDRLVFSRGKRGNGKLYLLAEGAFATHLHHLAPVVCERVNGFFGYKAVAELVIRQGSLKHKIQQAKKPPELDDSRAAVLDALVQSTGDDGLRESLEKLGRSVLANTPKDA